MSIWIKDISGIQTAGDKVLFVFIFSQGSPHTGTYKVLNNYYIFT